MECRDFTAFMKITPRSDATSPAALAAWRHQRSAQHRAMGGGGSDAMQRLTGAENLAVGVSAGTIEVVLLQPMLYCARARLDRHVQAAPLAGFC
eukprot:5429077-Pleurochrysis_carterae.AAC.3